MSIRFVRSGHREQKAPALCLATGAPGLVCRCNAGDVFSSPATKLTDSIFRLVVRPYGYGEPSTFQKADSTVSFALDLSLMIFHRSFAQTFRSENGSTCRNT